MKVPSDTALTRPRVMRGYQAGILLTVISLVLLVVFVQAIANAYTNYLWYRSIHLTMIWRSIVETKLGLAAIFSGTFFVACWVSLAVADNVSVRRLLTTTETEVVRRYQTGLGRFRVTVRTVVALVLSLAVGAGTGSQWKHWLLFVNGGSFGVKDPQFHRDAGFFVFRLPFLSFLVDWSLIALAVLFIVTGLAYFLSGGLRLGGPSPRVDPGVTAHLSLILAVMALVRAAGYVFVDRYALDVATNGVVDGAGFTDVHVRLPAMTVLAVVSMIAFVLLTYNVYHRTLQLPAVAVGLWVFIAFVLGLLYPAIVQWVQVNPSQSTLEQRYLVRNIAATRQAFGLNDIKTQNFGGHADLKAPVVNANASTLGSLPLWNPTVAASTYDNLQSLHGYYHLAGLSIDRYELGTGASRALTPVVVGTRELLQSGEPRNSWVNEHLEYTHGYGVVMSPANAANGNSGQPSFAVSGVPVQSAPGAPKVTQPDVYFGDSPHTYVLVDTRQPELNYEAKSNPKADTGHYTGEGGVQLTGFWQRAAFAMRFHDYNLLISHLVTKQSRVIYLQDVEQRVQRAVPFLKVDSHPYPVVANGQIYWIVDCYTTTSYYPYSEQASTGLLPGSSGLQGGYNYVRDSVKAVVNAYTGRVSLFAADPSDPVLTAWEHAYPGMFKPLKDMAKLSPTLLDHLRYPQDLLTVLSSMYGRYHFAPTPDQAEQFYSYQNAWSVAQSNNGVAYKPQYELLRLPGKSSLSFVAVEPMVPASSSGNSQLLTAFLTANSGYKGYGSITAYQLPHVSSNALGPALVAAKVGNAAKQLASLNEQHAKALFGPTLLVPIDDSLIYVQPLYISSTTRPFPTLEYVATAFGGNRVGIAPTLLESLRQIFGSSVSGVGPPSSATLSERVQQDLEAAYAAYEKSVVDGKHFRLGAMQKDLQEMGQYLAEAHRLIQEQGSTGSVTKPATSSSGPSSSSPSSSTTVPRASSTTSTTKPPPTTSSSSTSSSSPASSTGTSTAPSGGAAKASSGATSVSTTTQAPRVG